VPPTSSKIAANDGGAQGLQAGDYPSSSACAIERQYADVIKIAANDGGSQALQAVISHHWQLTQIGFSAIEL